MFFVLSIPATIPIVLANLLIVISFADNALMASPLRKAGDARWGESLGAQLAYWWR